jgi:XTP/dITP diphosphohydrolase
MKTIILASHNLGKRQELQAVLEGFPFTIQNAPDDWPEVDETGLTFVENAILKARSAAQFTGLPALADDSGIVVPALNGAPGIYSARYAGEKATAQDNIRKLLADMTAIPTENRQAFFYCCLVLMLHAHDQSPIIAEGIWPGVILPAPQGNNGFGYDPIVWIPDMQCSAAEMPDSEKSRLSHRARAAQELLKKLRTESLQLA